MMTAMLARLHIDPDMDGPMRHVTIDSPPPNELIVVDELTGIDVVYSLRRWHIPGVYDTDPASADYIWKGLA